jgi:hypothetical protein
MSLGHPPTPDKSDLSTTNIPEAPPAAKRGRPPRPLTALEQAQRDSLLSWLKTFERAAAGCHPCPSIYEVHEHGRGRLGLAKAQTDRLINGLASEGLLRFERTGGGHLVIVAVRDGEGHA